MTEGDYQAYCDAADEANFVVHGPVYELRNRRYEMDESMFRLLQDYTLQGKGVRAFFEGLEAGRIWEV
jgi:hypothetical protein